MLSPARARTAIGVCMKAEGAAIAGQQESGNAIHVELPADLPLAARRHIAQWGHLDLGPLSLNPAACLQPTDVMDSESATVVALAGELTARLEHDGERAATLYRHVRDAIRYDFAPTLPDRTAWRASATLARGQGFCQQKAVLLVALARASGIPAGLVFQHIVDWKLRDTRFEAVLPGGVILFHGLCALWLDGAWRAMDPSLDSDLCARRRYRLVEMPVNGGDALLPADDWDGNRHFDLLGQAGPYADLPVPVSDMLVALAETWAEMRGLVARTGATM